MKSTAPAVSEWRRRNLSLACLLIGIMSGLAGCSPQINNHGHRIDPGALSQIQPGRTGKQEVIGILGSPSSISTFDDERWYYISQKTESYSFYINDITQQDVVTINFDASGLVSGVDEHGMELAKAIEPVDDETPTLGKDLTLLEQFVGNIGRFETGESAAAPASRLP